MYLCNYMYNLFFHSGYLKCWKRSQLYNSWTSGPPTVQNSLVHYCEASLFVLLHLSVFATFQTSCQSVRCSLTPNSLQTVQSCVYSRITASLIFSNTVLILFFYCLKYTVITGLYSDCSHCRQWYFLLNYKSLFHG